MNKARHITLFAFVAMLSMLSCVKIDDVPSIQGNDMQKMKFDIMVTRDGKVINQARTGRMTKSMVETEDNVATMNSDIPFGLIGIDYESGQLVLDNASVKNDGSGYSALFDSYLWSASNKITFSAYYPYVEAVSYGSDLENYSISYAVNDTEAGPLVSKTVEKAVS